MRHPLGVRNRGQARWLISAETYQKIALAALVSLVLVVLTGAAVRLTGSGLGCPSWPKCTRTSLQPQLNSYALIEFGNRVLIFFVSAAALAAVVGAFLRRPIERRWDLVILVGLLPVGVIGQAVIGGESVLHKLAPGWVMSHYWLSMVILVAAFELWWRSRHEPDELGRPGADQATVIAVRAARRARGRRDPPRQRVDRRRPARRGVGDRAARPAADVLGRGHRPPADPLPRIPGDPDGPGDARDLVGGAQAGDRRARADAPSGLPAPARPGGRRDRPVRAGPPVGDRLGPRLPGDADLGRLRPRLGGRRVGPRPVGAAGRRRSRPSPTSRVSISPATSSLLAVRPEPAVWLPRTAGLAGLLLTCSIVLSGCGGAPRHDPPGARRSPGPGGHHAVAVPPATGRRVPGAINERQAVGQHLIYGFRGTTLPAWLVEKIRRGSSPGSSSPATTPLRRPSCVVSRTSFKLFPARGASTPRCLS